MAVLAGLDRGGPPMALSSRHGSQRDIIYEWFGRRVVRYAGAAHAGGGIVITRAHRQEALGKAYVRAIAAQAGWICSEPEQDYGIDLCLRAVRVRGTRHADAGGQLDLQLKCTTRANVTDTGVVYDLDVKNYDDLREPGENCPRILVVLVMPEDEAQWLTQSVEELVLRHCAYWHSLEGEAPTTTTRTTRITIPRDNVFSAEAVPGILARLRERKNP
jgi:hypothetical protein